MTDNKTIPEQFVKEWLPDYEIRFNEAVIGKDYIDVIDQFVFDHFPEALEAFKRHAQKEAWEQGCEKQREICAGEVHFESRMYVPERLRGDAYYACKNADTPEFKLTEKE